MAQQDLMQRWLRGRQTIIVELAGLAREVRSDATSEASLLQRLKTFCADIVDYVSAGHFEIYSRLVDTADAARLFITLGTRLQCTTDQVLAFNDSVTRARPDRARLRRVLADVGMALEERLALEDRLIHAARVPLAGRPTPRAPVFATPT